MDALRAPPPHPRQKPKAFERDGDRVHLTFDDSGGQDWAFVAMLPQLSGDDPTLRPSS